MSNRDVHAVGHSRLDLDPRAGPPPDEISQEMVLTIQCFRELTEHQRIMHQQLADLLASHMARQNMLFDKVILQIGITNIALEVMLGPAQMAIYHSRVRQMVQVREQKILKMNEEIARSQSEEEESREAESQSEGEVESP